MLPLKAAVGLLCGLELANQQLVPFFPGFDVALKERLRLVVTLIVFPSEARPTCELDLVHEVAERRLELRQVLAAGQRVNQRGDRNAGDRFIETAETARIGDLTRK